MKEFLSYHEYGLLIKELTEVIQKSDLCKNLKYIYAPPRGGLPIAVHLSHFLCLDFLPENYDRTTIRHDELLVVDDISDTGETLKWFRVFITASLYYKPWSKFKPNFYIKETTNWLVFPWEKTDETPNRLE